MCIYNNMTYTLSQIPKQCLSASNIKKPPSTRFLPPKERKECIKECITKLMKSDNKTHFSGKPVPDDCIAESYYGLSKIVGISHPTVGRCIREMINDAELSVLDSSRTQFLWKVNFRIEEEL